MGLVRSFFSQCARPEGFLGRVMLRFMKSGVKMHRYMALTFLKRVWQRLRK